MNKSLALAVLAGLSTVAFAAGGGITIGNEALTMVPACAVVYAPVTLSSEGSKPLDFGKVVSLNTSAPVTIALKKDGSYDLGNFHNAVPFTGAGSTHPTAATVKASQDIHLPVGFAYASFLNKNAKLKIDSMKMAPKGEANFNVPIYGSLTVPANTTGHVEGVVFVVAAYM